MKDKAIIFDMDGVIVDSEGIWDEAMVDVFQSLGLPFKEGDAAETRGLRMDEVVAYWHKKHPWDGASQQDANDMIYERVIQLTREKAAAMPGALDAIVAAHATGAHVAIASSAAQRLIDAVVERFDLKRFMEITHSAEHEAHGKPAPDVYLAVAEKLGVDPANCLAIEDSPNGMRAGKAAGMTVVGVPDPRFTTVEEVQDIAGIIETSLVPFTKERFESLLA